MPAQHQTYIPPETNLEPNEPYIITPAPSPEPRINCAAVFGVRPQNPVLFTIATTGSRPMTFRAKGLPLGLKLDSRTGRITGAIAKPGTYSVMLKASNSHGNAAQQLKIVVGDQIALTPPMGWNSWNCWAQNVTDENVRASAKAMVDTGLIDHGWTYINIDDTWQDKRGGKLNAIQPNQKFPDMKQLCDYIHSLGLKAGIYSTPWITSYAGHIGGASDNPDGSWQKDYPREQLGKFHFDSNDAGQWAAWGIDYLKYDWYPNDINSTKRMADALNSSGRDIVYSLSNTAPFDKAQQLSELANCWRTTCDIRDAWDANQLTPGDRPWAMTVTRIWDQQTKWIPFNRPGHWNDPDMLIVGKVGWGTLHPTKLTPDEQYSHISLWCLWSAPLLLGCPLDQIDAFTLNLLTNDEVLALNQDPLGRQAQDIVTEGTARVLSKDLADGSKAVGLINRGSQTSPVKVTWQQLGITGKKHVRDLWRQQNIGIYEDSFEAMVRPHGIVLIRVYSK